MNKVKQIEEHLAKIAINASSKRKYLSRDQCCTDEVPGLHIRTKDKEKILTICIGVTIVVFFKDFHPFY